MNLTNQEEEALRALARVSRDVFDAPKRSVSYATLESLEAKGLVVLSDVDSRRRTRLTEAGESLAARPEHPRREDGSKP